MTSEYESEATAIVDKLYEFRDQFVPKFGMEKVSQKSCMIKEELEKTLKLLEQYESKCQKTYYFLQVGRALNILPEYSSECEGYLSKAVKRDPSLVEAWNLLGETFWKKSDFPAAKNCFEGSLKREKNKVALRSLSMVMRQMKASKPSETTEIVMSSLEFAKNAVELDTSDGMSWYILGNAFLSLFFASDQSSKGLSQALSSYSQAEKLDISSKYNPDLHFNRAQAYRYEESYNLAFEGWKKAHQLDPEWKDPQLRTEELIDYLKNVSFFVEHKGKLKAKRLQGMIKSINEKSLGPYGGGGYKGTNGEIVKLDPKDLSDLEEGTNTEKVVTGCVVCNFADKTLVPFTFAMVDKKGECCAVTVYNLAQGGGVIIGDTVAIPEPYVTHVKLNLPDKAESQCKFTSIRVGNPTVMVVNGKKLGKESCAFTKVSFDSS